MRRRPTDIDFEIDPDIGRARTLPSAAYTDPAVHETLLESAFATSWQWIGDAADLRRPGTCLPRRLLPGALDEPLLLTRDREDRSWCLSNVCTHRGNQLVAGATSARELRCGYHGRRFTLDGACRGGPGFDEVDGFPCEEDALPRRPLARLGPLLFTTLGQAASFDETAGWLESRVAHLGLEDARFDASRSRDYLVEANWALYCDNYLEGFHIPFVHAGLAGTLDSETYRVELQAHGSLQLADAAPGERSFRAPAGHPDEGTRIAAYYAWLFPNTMINVYPWGVSLNVVVPLAVDRTRVVFRSYVLDPDALDEGAGAALDRVEREDEVIVESCQSGIRSRLYDRGRYAPREERGVHHFHRLLATSVAGKGPT